MSDRRGIGMPEAMLAVLLFSVMVQTQLVFWHSLERRQEELRQFRHALGLAHQALECHARPALSPYLALPSGWRLDVSRQPRGHGCVRTSVVVLTAGGQRAELNRWFCA